MHIKEKLFYKARGVSWEEIERVAAGLGTLDKRFQREKEMMKKKGYTVTLFSHLEATDDMLDRALVDLSPKNPEELMLEKEKWELLFKSIGDLSDEDREFITRLFWEEDGNVAGYARKLAIPRETARYKRDRILGLLKKNLKKNQINFAD